MTAYPDTSFLCGIYRQQDNSKLAAAYFRRMPEPLHVSSLLLFEFRQSLRFQVWLHAQDPRKGFSKRESDLALSDLESDLRQGAVVVISAEWAGVHVQAEDLSRKHTMGKGHRSFDLLHIATALHLKAPVFLSFDGRQRELAQAEGMTVRPSNYSIARATRE